MQDYLTQRETLIRDAVPGSDPARRLARLTDEMLAESAMRAAKLLPRGVTWSLVALGGYGAGQLLPASDLDLLVITNARSSAAKPFVEALLYPLWDAGLKVGHQVRSPREQLRGVRADLATLTATLTGRHLAGDAALSARMLAECAADARRRRDEVLSALRARPRPGSPYLLEPDLKDGAGGRRDFDELSWSAAVVSGAPQTTPGALAAPGFLTGEELAGLTLAADLVTAARWELQVAGSGNLMTLDAAEDATFDPGAVQTAVAETHHVLRRVRARLAGGVDAPPGARAAADVMAMLRKGVTGAEALEDAVWSGGLDHLVPGLRESLALRRPGLAHIYTVGAHSVRAAGIIADLARDGAADELLASSLHATQELAPLLVAGLTHDLGKLESGPGHPERGARLARDAAVRLGLASAADTVAALVRLHLVLAETAARDDLDDEDAILRCAERVGRRDLVAPLHVLTVADSLATGAGAWSGWHAVLLGKLVTRLDAALSPEIDGAGVIEAAEHVRAIALASLGGAEAGFVRTAPLRYLASRAPEEVTRHADLVARLLRDRRPGAHAIDITAGPMSRSFVVTIATRDTPGLFATLAGVFSLAGLDILGVQALSAGTDIALDTFTVRPATQADVGPDVWARFERSLDAALRGRLSLASRLAERRRHYRHVRHGVARVRVSTGDPFAAVVRITAKDRVGLLYDVARAIADAGLDIRSVTATTKAGTAEDTFRLTDAAGEMPGPGLLGKLQMHLRELG